jgi:hypothetical protein
MYDLYLFALTLKQIQADLAIPEASLGVLGSLVRLGAFPACLVALVADRGLCRKIAFSRQNPKIVYWKINVLQVQTFLFWVICDRARTLPGGPPVQAGRCWRRSPR